MSDLKGIEISDVLGLSKPLTKLVETVSGGIGKLYEPLHIKRVAKAKAEELRTISGAMEECSIIPTQYSGGSLLLSNTDWEDFVKRTQARMAFQELKKQNNIECVVANAYSILEDEQACSDKPVDDDWICSFFDFVTNVSSEQMQILWGKLLAGEIMRPGSCSIRTLDVLRKLTQKEATLFQTIIPYIFKCWADETKTTKDYFILSDCSELIGISFSEIVILNDSGLVNMNNDIITGFTIFPNGIETIEGTNRIIEFRNSGNAKIKIGNNSFLLTESGKELYDALFVFNAETPNKDFYDSCVETIEKNAFFSRQDWFEFIKISIADKENIIE